MTGCEQGTLPFSDLGSRKVVVDFSGGTLSTDGGALLLRQTDRGLGLTRQLARCFVDTRDARWVDHSLEQLLAQRLYGLALGYEDLNDHQALRRDPLLAVACEKKDPQGDDRLIPAFRGVALASAPTLNRLELSNERRGRGHKLQHDPEAVAACVLEMGVRCLPKHTREVVLDVDAMGHRLHGEQEGRFFHGYYDDYCYLPLYIFAGSVPLWAQLRTADQDAAHGVVEALDQVVKALRARLPGVRILVRADSGFCREELLAWCEGQREVWYAVGLARNPVLERHLEGGLMMARARQCLCGVATREFIEFEYATRTSWSRERRVIGKAEWTTQGSNPRFVVTNLPANGFAEDGPEERFSPRALYEEFYCGRGNMENQLKQQVLDLRADRMSTHHLGSNQLRLWLSTLAYLLLERLRTVGLAGTQMARATVGSIRLHVLKVAAEITISVRRVHVRLSTAWPGQAIFRECARRLAQSSLWSG
jgi:hypothetical protein